MAGLLLLFLVMEDMHSNLANAHGRLFSDNSPTVAWVESLMSKTR